MRKAGESYEILNDWHGLCTTNPPKLSRFFGGPFLLISGEKHKNEERAPKMRGVTHFCVLFLLLSATPGSTSSQLDTCTMPTGSQVLQGYFAFQSKRQKNKTQKILRDGEGGVASKVRSITHLWPIQIFGRDCYFGELELFNNTTRRVFALVFGFWRCWVGMIRTLVTLNRRFSIENRAYNCGIRVMRLQGHFKHW